MRRSDARFRAISSSRSTASVVFTPLAAREAQERVVEVRNRVLRAQTWASDVARRRSQKAAVGLLK